MAKQFASSARAGRAGKKGRPTRRRGIDRSDSPEGSSAQLRALRRVGRPPLGAAARRLIAIRIDPHVLEARAAGSQAARFRLSVPYQRAAREARGTTAQRLSAAGCDDNTTTATPLCSYGVRLLLCAAFTLTDQMVTRT